MNQPVSTDSSGERPESRPRPAGDETAVSPVLSVSRVSESVSVLGPGLRAVVWVQGCPLRCPGCVAPEGLPFAGGEPWPVPALAARLNALPAEVTGVTFSGGEPMAQAGALVALVDRLRAEGRRDWSVMSYSGFTLEHLRRGTPDQRELLSRLDILVDGPYIAGRHGSLLWRGSDNQRLLFLTDRHHAPGQDSSAGLEFEIANGTVHWTGVPPHPGFREQFEHALHQEGVTLPDPRRNDVR